ncbi:hypothetical protein PPL_10771 [Heterostelium album PN500]|uniref:Uncharacterized protein n=1 Tax=Heterostelium pallidum (strain ATCC 26659 / Pp 5 / PN500) TaxID=670386 RepID=D3BRY1_HETP5|nr:hypothetical protein PPL_10771 [Heterostelium album PN500]EFA75718.1 hypothetical protein PPL_10771 [Heterostelium album PN500]|eukprot:XP_020427852.1 hypothetical protein PPL_10771 [Heterostelium album PN500]
MTLIAALSSIGSIQSTNSIFKSQTGVTGTSSSQSSNKVALLDAHVDAVVDLGTLLQVNATADVHL